MPDYVLTAERRIEKRRFAIGEVQMRQSLIPDVVFTGRLVDVSPGGFRVRHGRFALTAGELVAFEFEQQSGLAKVMWTRIVGQQVETGFRLCEEDEM